MSWIKTRIGDFLIRSKIPVDVNDSKEYKRVTIRIKHNGVSLRDLVKGKKIGTKKQFLLRAGQFIMSKIDARYGAFGIAPPEVDNAIITGNFWAYDVDESKVSIDWFNQFTNSRDFYQLCERASSGITHRKYLDEAFFLNHSIDLPPIEDQLLDIKKINFQKGRFTNLSHELTYQLSLVKQLRHAFLREAMQGKLVPQDPNDEPASELLKKIKAEKEQLIKEKKIKKEKELPTSKPEEIPFEIPKSWVWCRLGEIIFDTEGGKSPNCVNESVKGDEWGVIKTTAVQEMTFLENENKVLPKNFVRNPRHVIEAGDILITRAGPKNRVGIVCSVDALTKNLILSDKTIRIIYPKYLVSSKFIAFALNSPLIKPIIETKMTGMADSQVNISQDNMKGFPIPFPSLLEQYRIVAKLEQLMNYCNKLEQSIKQSQMQNEKLLQQVLREALQPNKTFEPREVLSIVAEQ